MKHRRGVNNDDIRATDGIIANNKIFWNNFDYYLPGSPVNLNNYTFSVTLE